MQKIVGNAELEISMDKSKPSDAAQLKRPPGHGRVERGLDAVARAPEGFGRFGRMFPELAPARFGATLQDDQALMRAIAETMINTGDTGAPIDEAEPLDENPNIPAGYTYFGQFVDHDITFDTASDLDRDNDPGAVEDFRTARLDLDSVYGRGPTDQPYLYNPDLTIKLGANRTPAYLNPAKRFDVQRAPADLSGECTEPECNRAVIGDPRNDENAIVVQIHALWQRLHNKIMAELAQTTDQRGPITGKPAFDTAQRRVRWHYQWVVLHDFLRRIVGDKMFNAVYSKGKPDLQFYQPDDARYPYMPVEFSVAAYRFGHSMVRPSYSLSAMIPHMVVPGPNNLKRLPIFALPFSCGDIKSLNGFRPLNDPWGIDWSFFLPGLQTKKPPFDKKPFSDFVRPQPAYRIDTLLVDPLANLPALRGEPRPERRSLPALNLMRGVALGLPSGQEVARRMGLTPLTDKELWHDAGNLTDKSAIEKRRTLFADHRQQLHENAPLWYYILREAELADQKETEFEDDDKKTRKQKLGGAHLGDVGGRIVAEVLIGLVAHDNQSYLVQHPAWRPTLGAAAGDPAKFELADIVRYVDR
jgi:hypothetical protein